MADANTNADAFKAQDSARKALADVYTFVRSQEINRTIAAFTFDHYIDEAKRQIKGEGIAIRNASGQAIDVRPPQMDELTRMETDFKSALAAAKKTADNK